MAREALLEDVLERFLPDKSERDLLRERSNTEFPVQRIHQPVEVFERVRKPREKIQLLSLGGEAPNSDKKPSERDSGKVA